MFYVFSPFQRPNDWLNDWLLSLSEITDMYHENHAIHKYMLNTHSSRCSLTINTNSLFHNFGNVWKMHFYAVLIFIHGHGHPLKLPCCLQVSSYCDTNSRHKLVYALTFSRLHMFTKYGVQYDIDELQVVLLCLLRHGQLSQQCTVLKF